jgi:hypothetical protein
MTTKCVYLRHEDGATHALRGKRLAKLLAELKAGRGQHEICQLQAGGYTETLGGWEICGLTFEVLDAEARGAVGGAQ